MALNSSQIAVIKKTIEARLFFLVSTKLYQAVHYELGKLCQAQTIILNADKVLDENTYHPNGIKGPVMAERLHAVGIAARFFQPANPAAFNNNVLDYIDAGKAILNEKIEQMGCQL